jgi:hypothetical protein
VNKEQKAYLDQLNTLANDITKRVLTPDYAHLVELWKAFLGGFVGPEIAKLTPDAIDDKRKALMAQYDKEAIGKMINPDPIEVERVVEKVVYKDRVVKQPVSGDSGTGNMRYKTSVNKLSRKKRELQSHERQAIVSLFNQTQALMDKNDEACKKLVDELNQGASEPTSNLQVAGYWSWLCRVVLKTEDEKHKWYDNAVKKGSIPSSCPMPTANDSFKKLIIENRDAEQTKAAHRNAYKSHMASTPSPADNKPSSISFT